MAVLKTERQVPLRFTSGGKFLRLLRVLLLYVLVLERTMGLLFLPHQNNKLPVRNRLNCAQILKTVLGLCAVNFRS